MRLAVLGLGNMGRALAARLLGAGHDVAVWNRSPGRSAGLAADGAREARSVGDAVAGADLAITALADDGAVREVALGAGGVAATLGLTSLYADCSTVSPDLSAELAGALGPGRFVALPILGAPAAVAAGQATYLAGGDDHALARLDPVLAALGGGVRRYGAAPLASAAKLTSNLLLLTGVVALAEAVAVGRAGGLSDGQLHELLAGSPMVAPGLANRFDRVLAGSRDGWWPPLLGAKDAGLAVSLARQSGVSLPMAAAAGDQYRRTAADLPDAADIAAVAALYSTPPDADRADLPGARR